MPVSNNHNLFLSGGSDSETPGKESRFRTLDRATSAPPMDIRTALKEAMSRLRAAQVPSHTLASELLLMHALGRDRTWLYTHPEMPLDPSAQDRYFALIARRTAGEPVQYITGKQEFWGLEFEVTPDVLIPRPETEHVIEVALERLGMRGIKIRLDTGEPSAPLRIADVGTGSGCLAVALAHELPHATVLASDISASALVVARRNATLHRIGGQIHFLQCDLLSALLNSPDPAVPFDLIVSNPPYVAGNDAATLPREVRDHEPHTALFGGPTGTEIYTRLLEQARALLRPAGALVVELGYGSADAVLHVCRERGAWCNVSITNDLAGIPRVLAAERME